MALSEVQQKVFDLKVKDPDIKNVEIARALNISPQRVGVIMNHPKFHRAVLREKAPLMPQKKLREIQEEILRTELRKAFDPVIQTWKKGALPAAENIIRLAVQAEDESIQLAASKETVNQAGYVPEKKVTTMTMELSSQDADRIEKAFRYSQTRTREIV